MSDPRSQVRAVAIVLGVAMLVFGMLQINDPDPWLWVSYYVAAAAVCLLAAFDRSSRLLWLGVLAASLFALLWNAPGLLEWALHHPTSDIIDGMSADRPYIEESREFLGVAIAVICMLIARRSASTS